MNTIGKFFVIYGDDTDGILLGDNGRMRFFDSYKDADDFMKTLPRVGYSISIFI